MVKEFNKYSRKNNLDITLELTLFNIYNSTITDTEDYVSTLQSLFNKKNEKYDIFNYNIVHIMNLDSYFLNIKEFLSDDEINIYNPKILSSSYHDENKIVGLPIYLDYSFLYSNTKYLNKYKKNIPKTWNELIETASYILNEERKLNNTDLIGYNGCLD
eukprot:jgi/Orpsp1_1/1185621/evm.model.c7180000094654.1